MESSFPDRYTRRNSLRLSGFDYGARRLYFVTFVTADRRRVFLNTGLAEATIQCLADLKERWHFAVYSYCLMPDHLHLVWMGLRLDSDQLNGMAFLRTHLEPKLAPQKFQHQAHDHVLKEEERRRNAFVRVCNYILENPLRAELVKHPTEWTFNSAVVPGYPTLHPLQDGFWPKFWKLYGQAKHPDAGKIRRPPIR